MENTFREEKERFQRVLELNPDGIYIHVEDVIVFVNDAAVRLFRGQSAADLVGRKASDLIEKTDRERLLRTRSQIEDRDRTDTLVEFNLQLLDGSVIEGETFGISIPWEGQRANMVTVRDISARRRAERVLRESEARYRSLFDVSPDAIYVHADDRILFANPAAAGLFGYDRSEDLVGQMALELIPPEERDLVRQRRAEIHRLGGQGSAAPLVEQRFVRRDRSEFDGEAIATEITWEGQPGILVITRDISERKRITDELEEAKETAELANRAKSDFLANMSHEIRTPMNGVLGMADILLRSDLTADQRKHALIIKESGDALLAILNDILDLSKIEAGRIELENLDFRLSDVFDAIEAIWSSRLEEKGLVLSIEMAPGLEPILKGDPGRIRQILFNLLGNAAKFTETGGVTVGVTQRSLSDGALEIRCAVADTGIGISPEAQSRLFSSFSQADSSTTRRFGGSGLGLAICKQLAELMGGEMGVDSTPDQGSTFWFTFRAAPGNPETAIENPFARDHEPFEMSAADRPLRVLVAEDNRVNQAVILAMLAPAGHQIDMVENGVEAVAAVARAPYDLVLMDVQMPEMDGVAATGRIRELEGDARHTPIIGVTANAMKGDQEKYLSAGMDDYVTKPIDPRRLAEAIARHCGGAGIIETDDGTATPPSTSDESQEDLAELLGALDDMIEKKA